MTNKKPPLSEPNVNTVWFQTNKRFQRYLESFFAGDTEEADRILTDTLAEIRALEDGLREAIAALDRMPISKRTFNLLAGLRRLL